MGYDAQDGGRIRNGEGKISRIQLHVAISHLLRGGIYCPPQAGCSVCMELKYVSGLEVREAGGQTCEKPRDS